MGGWTDRDMATHAIANVIGSAVRQINEALKQAHDEGQQVKIEHAVDDNGVVRLKVWLEEHAFTVTRDEILRLRRGAGEA